PKRKPEGDLGGGRRRRRPRACPAATPSGPVSAGGGRRGVSSTVDLLDLEYLDPAVGHLPELDGDVLRHERAPDAHPALLPVDHVAIQIFTCINREHQKHQSLSPLRFHRLS
ncbi:hypothetical protein EJB05_48965, partial [Eragrostis curvula]